jgi:D-arabinose 1-dehydrogenase-like Zn-dependent alcohol dehydrogenase
MSSAARSSSDEHVFEGHMGMKYPRVPGHEIAGTIAAIPPTEKHWKLGQRVGAGWHGGQHKVAHVP